jgi:hypothetical protein
MLRTRGYPELLPSSGSRRGGPAETLDRCSRSCSEPSGKRVNPGQSGWLRQNLRTETDRFRGFWTGCLRIRDREAPGSNPGPPTILNSEPSNGAIQRAPGCHWGSQGDHKFLGEHGASSPFEVVPRPLLNSDIVISGRYISRRTAQDREAPGFENQRRCPRWCAADAQVRTVRPAIDSGSGTQ